MGRQESWTITCDRCGATETSTAEDTNPQFIGWTEISEGCIYGKSGPIRLEDEMYCVACTQDFCEWREESPAPRPQELLG